MNQEVLVAISPTNPPDTAESEIFQNPDNKKMVLNLLLHAADISNPCKPWRTCRAWALRVLEEFFAQGDQEKALGIPVQMLNDREKVNRPNSQIGFIEFIVSPLIAAEIKLFPQLADLGDNIVANLGNWDKMWVDEFSPALDEQEKVKARIAKAEANMTEAKYRGMEPDVVQARRTAAMEQGAQGGGGNKRRSAF